MTTVVAVSNNPASPFYNANAPGLTGQAGSLTTLLDALLVNGFTGYSAPGWTINQTTTNKRGYKMASGTGFIVWVDDTAPTTAKEARLTGFETMTGLGTGTGQFPTGAQLNIGTTPNGALILRKSTTADSTNRFYTFIADPTCFYMFVETGDFTSPTACMSFSFGDFFTYSSSDTSNCQIQGRNTENVGTVGGTGLLLYEGMIGLTAPSGQGTSGYSALSATVPGCYLAANYTNVGGSLPFGKHTDAAKLGVAAAGSITNWMIVGGGPNVYANNTGSFAAPAMNYPNGPDGGLYTAPIFIHHNGNVRGYLKGLWAPLQLLPLDHNDTYSGTGNMSGKSLLAMGLCGPVVGGSSGFSGTCSQGSQVHAETSSTWG